MKIQQSVYPQTFPNIYKDSIYIDLCYTISAPIPNRHLWTPDVFEVQPIGFSSIYQATGTGAVCYKSGDPFLDKANIFARVESANGMKY